MAWLTGLVGEHLRGVLWARLLARSVAVLGEGGHEGGVCIGVRVCGSQVVGDQIIVTKLPNWSFENACAMFKKRSFLCLASNLARSLNSLFTCRWGSPWLIIHLHTLFNPLSFHPPPCLPVAKSLLSKRQSPIIANAYSSPFPRLSSSRHSSPVSLSVSLAAPSPCGSTCLSPFSAFRSPSSSAPTTPYGLRTGRPPA